MSVLDEHYDQHAPMSRDKLAAKQAQQQAQADREGVLLETIRFREREAAKDAERDAQRQRSSEAAAALASAQATIPPPAEGSHPALRGVYNKLVRQELARQRQAADEWARQRPEEARAAAEAARSRAEHWRRYVAEHPDLRAADGTPRDYDPLSVPEWFT